jgi:tRNA(adenine34) deaminase
MLPVRTSETFMKETLAIAEDGLAFGEFPIAAILVLGDEIVARASTAEECEGRTFVHAEYAVLYTNLEPCLMCMGAAMSFFLGEIYYGLESPGAGARKKPIFPGTSF